MPTRPMVGCRVPPEWKEKIEAIGAETGRHASQIVYEAVERYLAEVGDDLVSIQIQKILQRVEALETDSAITTLSLKVKELDAKAEKMQALLTTLNPSSLEGGERGKLTLTAEQLAMILKVTPRSVNMAAAKGIDYFSGWTQQHSKTNKWSFEVVNPGAKKATRHFFSIY